VPAPGLRGQAIDAGIPTVVRSITRKATIMPNLAATALIQFR
jgi:hypothetical protein